MAEPQVCRFGGHTHVGPRKRVLDGVQIPLEKGHLGEWRCWCWECWGYCWESNKTGRLTRETVWFRQSSNMNRDEGLYQLNHVWDSLLTDVRDRKSVLRKAADQRPNRWCEKSVVVMLSHFTILWPPPSVLQVVFSALTLLVGCQEEHLACKNWVMRCWCGYLSGARCRLFAYGPADATASQNPVVFYLI